MVGQDGGAGEGAKTQQQPTWSKTDVATTHPPRRAAAADCHTGCMWSGPVQRGRTGPAAAPPGASRTTPEVAPVLLVQALHGPHGLSWPLLMLVHHLQPEQPHSLLHRRGGPHKLYSGRSPHHHPPNQSPPERPSAQHPQSHTGCPLRSYWFIDTVFLPIPEYRSLHTQKCSSGTCVCVEALARRACCRCCWDDGVSVPCAADLVCITNGQHAGGWVDG